MFIIKLLTFLSRKNANFMLSALLKYVILLQTDHFKSVFSEPTETAENTYPSDPFSALLNCYFILYTKRYLYEFG